MTETKVEGHISYSLKVLSFVSRYRNRPSERSVVKSNYIVHVQNQYHCTIDI